MHTTAHNKHSWCYKDNLGIKWGTFGAKLGLLSLLSDAKVAHDASLDEETSDLLSSFLPKLGLLRLFCLLLVETLRGSRGRPWVPLNSWLCTNTNWVSTSLLFPNKFNWIEKGTRRQGVKERAKEEKERRERGGNEEENRWKWEGKKEQFCLALGLQITKSQFLFYQKTFQNRKKGIIK